MFDVFICHADKDKAVAVEIARRIEAAGLRAFVDVKSIQPGEKWAEQIRRELSGCWALIFLATPSSLKSVYVQQELGMAVAKGIQVIPIVWGMKASELPGWTKDYQAIVLTDRTDAEVEQQIGDLVSNLANQKQLAVSYQQLCVLLVVVGLAVLVLSASKGGA